MASLFRRINVLILLAITLSSALITQPANATPGLGGGAQFASGTTFPFVGGKTSHIDSAMNVQNLGQYDAEVEFASNVPAGVTIAAISEKSVMIKSGDMIEIPFRITVKPMVAPGKYEVISTVKQINVPQATTGTTYAPAVGTKFVIEVFGAGSALTVKAINIETKKPIKGNISLFYVDAKKMKTLVDKKTGTTLNRVVVAGSYTARFEIAGLTQKSIDFVVKPKTSKTVYLGVHALEIVAVKAEPKYQDDGTVNQVDLTLGVRNGIAKLEGPVAFSTKVYLNDELVDNWTFSTQPELAVGLTEQKNRYVTGSSLSPGTWKFVFIVSTNDFNVTSSDAESFVVEETLLTKFFSVVKYIVVISIWTFAFWLLWKRRKEKDEDEK